jgi:phytoene dehydrogenase-like protein
MNDKSLIIIGAGIAGLSAGCYGQMNGYKTRIFELHNLPGGLCTSWMRKGFTFDGCIHWLVGTNPKSGMNVMYRELGALQKREIVNHNEFVRVVHPSGKTLIVYTNANQLEKHMLELAPEDESLIKEFCSAVRDFSKMDPGMSKPKELMKFSDMLQMAPMIPLMGKMKKFGAMNIKEYSDQFKNPVMRELFYNILPMAEFPVLVIIMTLAWQHDQDAGYPVGGSLAFSKAIEKRYRDLGGDLHYNSRVVKILVENDHAVGVQLENGEEYHAERVISAADGYSTIFKMLGGKYLDDDRRQWYDSHGTFQPIVMASFGINQDLSNIPHQVNTLLDQPVQLAGETHANLGFKHYCYDPTLAPVGKSVVEMMINSSYEYWKALSEDSERYEAEKKTIAIKLMDFMEQKIPGFKSSVEVVDIATPLTFERYTGNWKGIWEGWTMTKEDFGKQLSGEKMISDTLPGLENFYMVGQWTTPGGGIPPAVTSGRNLIQILCNQDKQKFTTSTPA